MASVDGDYIAELSFNDGEVGGFDAGAVGLNTGVMVLRRYAMRADDGVGGYVQWTVSDVPDVTGSQAPSPIVPGSAVVMAVWDA